MALNLTTPIVALDTEGVERTFDKATVTLNSSPRFDKLDEGKVGITVNIRFTGLVVIDGITYLSKDNIHKELISDIYESTDAEVQVAFGKIQYALGEYLQSKGL